MWYMSNEEKACADMLNTIQGGNNMSCQNESKNTNSPALDEKAYESHNSDHTSCSCSSTNHSTSSQTTHEHSSKDKHSLNSSHNSHNIKTHKPSCHPVGHHPAAHHPPTHHPGHYYESHHPPGHSPAKSHHDAHNWEAAHHAPGHFFALPPRRGHFKHYIEGMNKIVKETAARKLVGRKIIAIYGPIGGGMQSISEDIFAEKEGGKIHLLGTGKPQEIEREARNFIKLPIIYKDFVLSWRDLELAHYNNVPIDLSIVEHAASQVFYSEDDMIFNGAPEFDQPGILNVEGRNEFTINGWKEAGDGLKSVVEALSTIYKKREVGPFAMALHPDLFASLHRLYGNSGLLEIRHIERLVTAGIYPTPVLPPGIGVLFPVGSEHMDIVIGQPETVVYRCHRDVNPEFRVMETIGLRIKKPSVICVFRTKE